MWRIEGIRTVGTGNLGTVRRPSQFAQVMCVGAAHESRAEALVGWSPRPPPSAARLAGAALRLILLLCTCDWDPPLRASPIRPSSAHSDDSQADRAPALPAPDDHQAARPLRERRACDHSAVSHAPKHQLLAACADLVDPMTQFAVLLAGRFVHEADSPDPGARTLKLLTALDRGASATLRQSLDSVTDLPRVFSFDEIACSSRH